MSLHLKQATLTFLEHLFLSALVTAIFAFSDYLANHDTIDWRQVLLVIIVPVSVAALSSIKTYYQTKGDLAAIDVIDQLTPRIQQIEQRVLQMSLSPPPQAPIHPPTPPPGLAQAMGAPIHSGPPAPPLILPPMPPQGIPTGAPPVIPETHPPGSSFGLQERKGGSSSLYSFRPH